MKKRTLAELETMRDEFVAYLERFLFHHYAYGGDDAIGGIDCSGLMVEGLQSVGILEHGSDYTADALMRLLRKFVIPPENARHGCLVFYLKGGDGLDSAIAEHVEAFVTETSVIGAIGGGKPKFTWSDVVALHPRMADFPKWLVERWILEHEADRRGAFVKIRPFGYRSQPFVVVDPFMIET